MNLQDDQLNTGFIPVEPTPTDYIFGGNSPIPYEIRNPTGVWTSYAPNGENQKYRHFDSMACVTFSALDCIETQIKYYTGQTINFSDRFIAKLSGTTHEGNNMLTVIQTIKKYGLVLEEEWASSEDFNWEDYYAEIPQSVLDKAVKYDISYEWVLNEDLEAALKHAPIQVATAVCPGWNNPPVQNCPLKATHVTELLQVNPKTILDHYVPYQKTLADDYYLTYKLKIILNMTTSKLIQFPGGGFGFGAVETNEQALISQALQRGYLLPTINNGQNVDWTHVKADYKVS